MNLVTRRNERETERERVREREREGKRDREVLPTGARVLREIVYFSYFLKFDLAECAGA